MTKKIIGICLVLITILLIVDSAKTNTHDTKFTPQTPPIFFTEKDLVCIELALEKIQNKAVFNGNLPTNTSCKTVNEYFKLINSNSLTVKWSKAFLYLLKLHPELIIEEKH